MSVAGLVDRYARAIALAIALLAGAGIVAGNNLPSSIYPRLERTHARRAQARCRAFRDKVEDPRKLQHLQRV